MKKEGEGVEIISQIRTHTLQKVYWFMDVRTNMVTIWKRHLDQARQETQ